MTKIRFHDNIFIDLGNKNRVVEAFNSYIGKLDSIINDFNTYMSRHLPDVLTNKIVRT